MTTFNKYSKVNISPEMHILEPSWLHADFKRTVNQEIGSLEEDTNISKLVDLMFTRKFSGSFWNLICIDKTIIRDEIIQSDRSIREIFRILLKNDANIKNKQRVGAKFPVHFSYIDTLFRWFPNCLVVHITRDPRAIYASHSAKMNKNVSSRLKRILNNILSFGYINWDYFRSALIHNRYQTHRHYYLSRYEDIVVNPQEYLSRLCQFIGTDFSDKMLHPPLRDSSFDQRSFEGFNTQSVKRWQQSIHPITAALIKLINYSSMKILGYI